MIRSHSPRRRVLVGLAVALVLLVAGDVVLWQFALSRLETDVARWQAQLGAAGWTVETGPWRRGGWPLVARLETPALSIAGGRGDLPGGLAWRAEQVGLAVSLWRPGRLVVDVGGKQVLRLADLPPAGFAADRFRVGIPLGAAPSADLDAAGLRAQTPAGEATVATLTARGAANGRAPAGEPALALTATAGSVALPQVGWALGQRIASASLDVALTGPVPPGSVAASRAAAWRDGGGALQVKRLALGWGPLGLSGEATVGFDDHLQPAGRAAARIVGAAEALDALAAARSLPPQGVQAARGVLALLARVPEGGGAPEVDVPLTLRNRTLAIAGFPLLRLPEWVWSEPR